MLIYLMKLSQFNSTVKRFCTCLPKYNINPYLGGCAHKCIYHCTMKFLGFVGPSKPRLKLLDQIESMAKNTRLKFPVMISDCTDPYQPLEKEYEITRKCIQTLSKLKFTLLIIKVRLCIKRRRCFQADKNSSIHDCNNNSKRYCKDY